MNKTLNIKGRLVSAGDPMIMGILNVTPDSFYDGGRYTEEDSIKCRIDSILEEGADIIDIGAYSSRPGATDISVEEEWKRLEKALSLIFKMHPDAVVSVDTFRSEIVRKAVEAGAAMVNDISGGDSDTDMFSTIADLHVPYIMMHMQGTPQTMQDSPRYNNVTNDILELFNLKINRLRELGVKDIILDPGFGFGKTTNDNYDIMNNMEKFRIFGMPLLVGVSRKSMIYKTLNTDAAKSLNGTSVLNTIALIKGAAILRVHDVREAVECVKLYKECYRS